VPKGKPDLHAAAFGNQQSARLALSQRLKTAVERDDDQLLLVLVPSSGPPVQKLVPVSRAEALLQAKLFRLAVSDPEDDRSYRPLAQQMYGWLFAPVAAEVEGLDVNNVMYVVEAGLRTVPLAAMMDGDRFIVERYGLSLIPSVSLLQTSFGQSRPQPRILAAGADRFAELEALPAVSLELAAIGKSQPSTQVLLNEAFTQGNLATTRRQRQASTLHLATHGEFNDGELSSSYLQFWDSRLTFDQIRSLGGDELELLILSACATAISSPKAELGFAGLAAATGVESTIGSLWNVSDVGTLALMSEFYGHLDQSPLRVDAFRRSQLALLRGNTTVRNQTISTAQGDIAIPRELGQSAATDFRHPFYWAGFSLVGNPWW
jgi:CHAT domain-containing protein